jgi:hypothetical protein
MAFTVQELHRVWHDRRLTEAEVCEKLGVTRNTLWTLRKRHGLPKRNPIRSGATKKDPTIEEIYAKAAEIRAKRKFGSPEDESAAYTVPCYGGKPW